MFRPAQTKQQTEETRARARRDRLAKHMAASQIPRDPDISHTAEADTPDLIIFTDGSRPDNIHSNTHRGVAAGWGFVVWDRTQTTLTERYGPVITKNGPNAGASLPQYAGADKGSNNTGEVTAILEALMYLQDYVHHTPSLREGRKPLIMIRPDSKYAEDMTVGRSNTYCNPELAGNLRQAYSKACERFRIHVKWVKGHQEHAGNQRAD